MERLCIRFAKEGALKYISHLDLLRTFVRTIRRSGLPVVYSKGFKPRPKMTLAAPLPLGATSTGEYVEFFFQEKMYPEELYDKLAVQLPPGLKLMKAFTVLLDEPPLPSVIEGAFYSYLIPANLPKNLYDNIDNLLQSPEIKVTRNKGRGKAKVVNIRPYIYSIKVNSKETKDGNYLDMLLATGSKGGAKPSEIIELLGFSKDEPYSLHRHNLYLHQGGMFIKPEEIIPPKEGRRIDFGPKDYS